MKKTISFALILVLSVVMDVANADFIFGTPINLGPTVNSSSADPGASISADGLELYFESYRPGGFGDCDVWVTTRATIADDWGEPTNLGSLINSSAFDGGVCLCPDGLTLYFATLRTFDGNNGALMITRRATKSDNWEPPEILVSASPGWIDKAFPSISSDGLQMYLSEYSVFDPDGFGLSDLWISTRSAVSEEWDLPINIGPTVNSSSHDRFPSISADGLALFFNSNRPGGHGSHDLWVAMRVTEDTDWGVPMNLGPIINSSYHDSGPSISSDGRTLYFYSDRPGGYGSHDLYRVSIEPAVDLNTDGIVNADDMVIIVDHWGTDNSLCDIGPMPWGDGIVDVQDLIVLAEHLFEEVPPVQ